MSDRTLPHFVLGYHGCDRATAASVINGSAQLTYDSHKYDWLGNGLYFWENDPKRALLWAEELKTRTGSRKVKHPAVIGAVIDLGYCLNLIETENLQLLKSGYSLLERKILDANLTLLKGEKKLELPKNLPGSGGNGDLLLRNLDCAVIEGIHEYMREQSEEPFDSVRGVFWEGENLYPNAGFAEKNHIQICVRNQSQIKGFFYPR